MNNMKLLNAVIKLEPLISQYKNRLESELARMKSEIYTGKEFGKGNVRKELEMLRKEFEILQEFITEVAIFRDRQGLDEGELIPDIQTTDASSKWNPIDVEDVEVIEDGKES